VATEETKPRAADALRLTARELERFGVIDHVIPEPLGGAHRDARGMATTLKTYLVRQLKELSGLAESALLGERYQKFRRMGVLG
jgi:acetyl-CoA carboxylase carboxyl transferase subunit alpha